MAVSLHYDRDSFLILCMATIALYHRCHRLLARIPLIQAVSRVVQCSFSLRMIKLNLAPVLDVKINNKLPQPESKPNLFEPGMFETVRGGISTKRVGH